MSHSRLWYQRCAAALIAALAGGACSHPLRDESTATLRESVLESSRREWAGAQRDPSERTLSRPASELSFPPERLEELERMAGPRAYSGELPPLTEWLPGQTETPVQISLQQSVVRAVEHNLLLQSARIDPAIAEARVVAARAAFDWVFFASGEWARRDEPTFTPQIGAIRVGASANVDQTVGYTTGIRKELTSGGTLTITQGQTYRDDRDVGGSTVSPDPSNRAFLEVAYGQPLLRGFGSEVALAEVRLAQNTERRAVQEYRRALIETVTEVERAYWRLVLARRNLQIRQKLLERGIEVRDVLRSRLAFDVKPSEFSDAVARVESRRADVLRATNTMRIQSDRLKALINDPDLTVGGEALLAPIDDAVDAPIAVSLYDAMTTALAGRPEIEQAILAIDDASIRQTVAENARLPMLDMFFSARFQGLDRDVGDAYEDVATARFVNMLLGVLFEQPVGNREAEAVYRARQLERMQATVGYRQAVQDVALDVKTTLRDLDTNYRLIEQTRASRLAASENLRTLLVQEQTIQSLTPDFLDLKFRRQEALAQAELEEVLALTDYNIAIAEHHRSTGTALERNRIRFVVPDAGEPSNGSSRR